MDTDAVAHSIYDYTSGYPYLVSAICKIMDEELAESGEFENPAAIWTGEGIAVANRIFEMYLLNLFISEEAVKSSIYQCGDRDRNQFIHNNRLDMDLVLQKFVEHFADIYGDNDEKFVEDYGRKLFLLYLKPIINGTGNYYIEAQTRDAKRTDVVVDYLGEQFVVELKIWHGNEYNERGERQLAEYLDYFHQKKGYMLSFNFNKKKETGMKSITIGDKIIVEAVVVV